MARHRGWDVLLIGGASGTGKTSVSYRIAREFGVGITEVDDLWIMVEALTTPDQQPVLHRWATDPAALDWPAERIVDHTIEVCRILASGLRRVIDNHLEERTPVVLEGDYLLPELLRPGDERVRAVFLHEPDGARIAANLLEREPDAGPQDKRARVSWLFGRWLRDDAERRGIPVLEARPWETLFDRAVSVSDG
jgi:2-phosphoglycerate kinase